MGDPNKNLPPVIERPEAGGEIVRPAEDVGAEALLGEQEVSPEAGAAESRVQQRRAMFNNGHDAALAFAEGLVDALSIGLIHDTSEAGAIRRSVNPGSAFLGELAGTTIGLKLPAGPLKAIAGGGERAGVAAAKALVGEAEAGSRAAIALKTAGGAGEMAALAASQATGHQLTDAVLDDKEFSGYAVLEEAGLGAVLGGGFNFFGATFGRAASRAEIGAQGGLLDEGSKEFANVGQSLQDAKLAWDSVLETHERRLGVLTQLQKEGVLDQYINAVPEFLEQRGAAVDAARAARTKLEALSFEGAVDATPKQWERWHAAVENYQQALDSLDKMMSPSALEMAPRVVPGQPMPAPEGGPVNISEVVQLPDSDINQMNELMRNSPELRAQYEQIYGRPFEEVVRPTGVEGEENLGGKESPTTGNKTPVQSGRARQAIVEEPTPPAGAAPEQPIHSRFDVTDVDAEMAAEAEVQRPALPERPTPSEPTAGQPYQSGFDYAKFMQEGLEKGTPGRTVFDTPVEAAGAGRGGKFIPPSGEAQSLDNVLSQGHPDLARTQFKFSDGFFAPAADITQNARAFSEFMDRMSVDTPMQRAMAPELTGERTPVARPTTSAERTPLSRPAAPAFDPSKTTPVDMSRRPTPVQTTLPEGYTRAEGYGPQEEPRARLERGLKESGREEARRAVRDYIDNWYRESLGAKTLSPGDRASAAIRRVLDDIRATDKGRGISATSALGDHLSLPQPRTALGATLNDLYTMRRVAEAAAEASGGTFAKTGKVAGRTQGGKALNVLMRHMGGRAGAKALGGVLGGPLGYFAGSALVSKYFGFAGKAAGMAGRTYQAAIKAVAGLLKGQRATIIARAVAGNRPYVYSDQGEIEDPVERIAEIRRVAASPAKVAQLVTKSAGDLAVVHPELVQSMIQSAIQRVQYLASVAPVPQYDALGRQAPLTAKEQRQFLEAENATNDLEGILLSIGNGSVTRIQVQALQQAHTPAYHRIAAFLSQDPEVLQTLSREKLKVAEMVLGAPLTPGADPNFVARQQVGWTQVAPPAMQGAGPTQALKIPGAGGPPSAGPRSPQSNPTPSQSYSLSGRAPGN